MTTLSKDNLTFTDSVGRQFTIGFDGKNNDKPLPSFNDTKSVEHYLPTITRAMCTAVLSHNTLELCGYVDGTLRKIVMSIKGVNVVYQDAAISWLDANVFSKTLSIANISWSNSLKMFEADMRIESELISSLLQSNQPST